MRQGRGNNWQRHKLACRARRAHSTHNTHTATTTHLIPDVPAQCKRLKATRVGAVRAHIPHVHLHGGVVIGCDQTLGPRAADNCRRIVSRQGSGKKVGVGELKGRGAGGNEGAWGSRKKV